MGDINDISPLGGLRRFPFCRNDTPVLRGSGAGGGAGQLHSGTLGADLDAHARADSILRHSGPCSLYARRDTDPWGYGLL